MIVIVGHPSICNEDVDTWEVSLLLSLFFQIFFPGLSKDVSWVCDPFSYFSFLLILHDPKLATDSLPKRHSNRFQEILSTFILPAAISPVHSFRGHWQTIENQE
jgi:hypothetical protein